MSVEEAAQEVSRILHHNNAEEALRYLATVTRSIETHQQDLRDIIGSSYRDLLSACDAVVGMEQNCADIFAVSEALQRAQELERQKSTANGEPAPRHSLLPPKWRRQQRQCRRRVAAADVSSTDKLSKELGEQEEKDTHTTPGRREHQLPEVVLPLPLQPTARRHSHRTSSFAAAPAQVKGTNKVSAEALAASPAPTSTKALAADCDTVKTTTAEVRMMVESDLQSMHLQYITIASPMTDTAEATALDEFLSFHASAAETKEGGAGDTITSTLSGLAARLPLLQLACRLSRVQQTLKTFSAYLPASSNAAYAQPKGPRSSAVSWLWVAVQRAEAMEARVVRQLLLRLRQAADGHAQLLLSLANNQQVCNIDRTDKTSAATAPELEGGRSAQPDVAFTSAQAPQAVCSRQSMRLAVELFQAHAVLHVLSPSSSTLTNAISSYAPGATHKQEQASLSTVLGAGDSAKGDAQLETVLTSLSRLAAVDGRSAVQSVLPPPSSGESGADAMSLLLSLVAVLVLRESQRTSTRWSEVQQRHNTVADPLDTPMQGDKTAAASTLMPRARVFADDAFLASLGLSGSSTQGTAVAGTTITTNRTARGEERHGGVVSNTEWALRSFAGVSALLRSFADYVDLATAVQNSAPARSWEMVMADMAAVLGEAWRAAADPWRSHGMEGDMSAAHRRGATSIEELLTRRPRYFQDQPEGRETGPKTQDAVNAGESPMSTSRTEATAVENRTPPARRIVSTSSFSPNGSPLRDAATETSTTSAVGGAPMLADGPMRRRHYVSVLLASLVTIPALQVGVNVLVERGETGRSTFYTQAPGLGSVAQPTCSTPPTPAATGSMAAVRQALKVIVITLAAPLLSSVLVLLARDPVCIAAFGDYCDAAAALEEEERTQSISETTQDLRGGGAHLRTSFFSLSNLLREATVDDTTRQPMTLGQSWSAVSKEADWTRMRREALSGALQRCCEVALRTVSLLESSLIEEVLGTPGTTSKPTITSAEGTAQETSTPPNAEEVRRYWWYLFQELRAHTLHAVGESTMEDGSVWAHSYPGSTRPIDGAMTRSAAHTHEPTNTFVKGDRSSYIHTGLHLANGLGIDWERHRQIGSATALPIHSSDHCVTSSAVFSDDCLAWMTTCLSDTADSPGSVLRVLSKFQRCLPPVPAYQASTAVKNYGGDEEPDHQERVEGEEERVQVGRHAVTLLQRGLLAVVRAVTVDTGRTAKEEYDIDLRAAENALLMTTTAGTSSSSSTGGEENTTTARGSLYTRVVRWLGGALDHVESRLTSLTFSVPTASTPPSAIRRFTLQSVAVGYEMALLLRVYDDVLRQLEQGGRHRTATVAPLRSRIRLLLGRAQAPWQETLLSYYKGSLLQLYQTPTRGWSVAHASMPLDATETQQQEDRTKVHLGIQRAPDMSAWTSVKGSRKMAFPTEPTAALLQLVRQTLCFLHQAWHGSADMYAVGSASTGLEGTREGTGMNDPSNVQAAGAVRASSTHPEEKVALDVGAGGAANAGPLQSLVGAAERRQLLRELSLATRRVFLEDLLNTSGNTSGVATSPAGAGARTTQVTAPVSDAALLQWYADALFLMSVWGEFSEATAAPPFDAEGAAVGPAAVVSGSMNKPWRLLLKTLEQQCDPVRWQVAAPLIHQAHRRFLSATATLWITHFSHEDDVEGTTDNQRGTALSRVEGRTTNAMVKVQEKLSEVEAAMLMPLIAPTAPLALQPRPGIDRLALLPIAATSAAAAAAAATGNPLALRGPAALPLTAPTAAALNPYAAPNAVAGAVPVMNAASSSSSSIMSPWPSAAASGAGAGVTSQRAAASAVLGAGADAASSIWGTTQRGWNQLWGSQGSIS